MNIILFALSLKDASPEIRFFTIKLLEIALDENREINKTIQGLYEYTGVTKTVASKGIKHLYKRKVFTRKEGSQGRGRPRQECFLTEETYSQINEDVPIEYQNTHHQEAVSILLQNTKESGCHKDLRVSNKLLLIVMLVYADQSGVVKNLGRAELRRLTGLKKDGLEYQIQKLLDIGYIRSYISGVTHKQIFGIASGTYLLNLAKIKPNIYSKGIIISSPECLNANQLITNIGRPLDEHQVSHNILIINQVISIKDAIEGRQIMNDLLHKKLTIKFHQYLSFKINEYTSYLLSNFWEQLSEKKTDYYEQLVNKIIGDILPSSHPEESSLPSHIKKTALWMSIMAVDLASSICRYQEKHFSIPFENVDYSILPDKLNIGYVSIEIHTTKNSTPLKGWLLDKTPRAKHQLRLNQQLKTRHFEMDEQEIDLNDKYLYGLQEKPSN